MNITKEYIEQHWPLTHVVFNETLQDAGTRMVGLMTTDQGKYTFKIMDDWYTKAELTERLKIFDFLKEKNFKHITTLVKTKDNARLHELNGKFVLVLEYVEGKEPEETKENYQQLGHILGTLNNITDYTHPCLIPVDAIRPTWKDIAAKLDPSIQDEFMTIANNLPDIDGLPNSLIHFEIKLGRNNIQTPDGTIVFLDWDEAGRGATVLDPGYILINGFLSEDLVFDTENAQVFYDSYLATHPLTDLEKERMFDASLFHALRYIVYSPEKRWKRIKWAIENRKKLEEVYM
jgi:Ser/Thr protein kinase RdoA (MazF antagonist)